MFLPWWGWEVMNAVGVAVKRRRITANRVKGFEGKKIQNLVAQLQDVRFCFFQKRRIVD
jgi:hypothetical protein